MINYTERISLLMRDVIARISRLSYIHPDELLVFARYGRSGAEGAFATCHCLSLPQSEPGYYYWRDRQSGCITRRSRWFVTKSPSVSLGGRPVQYLVSFTLPRFCNQSLAGARKERFYRKGTAEWIAKLDTVVHELYHIDPAASGIRQVERADGLPSASSHGRDFLKTVADMVREYLSTQPDPAMYEFLRYTFPELEQRYGGVTATTFRNYPSYPQRYIEVLPPAEQLDTPPAIPIQPLRTTSTMKQFTDLDLAVRQFLDGRTRRLPGA
ncbi:MAG TPA: hypothetical protein VK911_07085 [Vicinamibacterales bacterium]|nr:hypothetical protein [Vicinamibacterales bacterium]